MERRSILQIGIVICLACVLIISGTSTASAPQKRTADDVVTAIEVLENRTDYEQRRWMNEPETNESLSSRANAVETSMYKSYLEYRIATQEYIANESSQEEYLRTLLFTFVELQELTETYERINEVSQQSDRQESIEWDRNILHSPETRFHGALGDEVRIITSVWTDEKQGELEVTRDQKEGKVSIRATTENLTARQVNYDDPVGQNYIQASQADAVNTAIDSLDKEWILTGVITRSTLGLHVVRFKHASQKGYTVVYVDMTTGDIAGVTSVVHHNTRRNVSVPFVVAVDSTFVGTDGRVSVQVFRGRETVSGVRIVPESQESSTTNATGHIKVKINLRGVTNITVGKQNRSVTRTIRWIRSRTPTCDYSIDAESDNC